MSKWMSLIGGDGDDKVVWKENAGRAQTPVGRESDGGRIESDGGKPGSNKGGQGRATVGEIERGRAEETEVRDEGVDVPKLMEAYEAHGGPFLKYL
ncbi:MAG: hypothetical protein MR609_07280 [Bacteroidales bacterium]|nr:hypothetical protein [Bacteroidales bacterium]